MNTRAMTLCIHAVITFVALPLHAAARVPKTSTAISGIPLAVVSVHDRLNDDVTDELRNALAAALSQQNAIHVVAQDRVAEVMAYHAAPASEPQTTAVLSQAMSLMEQAKGHYLEFAANEAQAEITAAIARIRAAPLDMNDKGGVLRDALVSAAFIYGGGASSAAAPYIKEVLQLDPGYSCDASQFPPKLRTLCTQLRAETAKGSTAELRVESDPKVADVSVNGIPKGVTPLRLTGLPAGSYDVRVTGNRYTALNRRVVLAPGQSETLNAKLVWKAGKNTPAPTAIDAGEAQQMIREGVRLVDLLRLQKVVLLDVDEEAGGGLIRARMIDATTKASHRPVVVQYPPDKSNLPRDMTEMVRLLTAQATMKRIDNPVAQLDPAGVGDPIVLGHRKQRRISPLGWGVIGGTLGAGALAGILAAVLSGGSSSSGSGTGNINVLLSK